MDFPRGGALPSTTTTSTGTSSKNNNTKKKKSTNDDEQSQKKLSTSNSMSMNESLFPTNKKREVKIEVKNQKNKKSKRDDNDKNSSNNDGSSTKYTSALRLPGTSFTANDTNVGLGHLKGDSYIEPVTFKKMTPGCLLIGYVLAIHPNSVIISLPGGVTGLVTYAEISDVCHKLLQTNTRKDQLPVVSALLKLHQYVHCYVLGASDTKDNRKKSLLVSLRASYINKHVALKQLVEDSSAIYGCIGSIEDHGYIVDVGIPNTTAFIPITATNTSTVKPAAVYTIGMPIECVVQSVNIQARTLKLKVHAKSVANSLVRHTQQLPFLSLVCGMLVDAIVKKNTENGLVVTLLGLFHGVIDLFHLPQPLSTQQIKERYPVGSVMRARIIFVDHGSKSLRLSMRHHVLNMRSCTTLPPLGAIVEELSIVHVHKQLGLLLTSTANNSKTPTVEAEVEGEGRSKQEGEGRSKQEGEGRSKQEGEGRSKQEGEGRSKQEGEGRSKQDEGEGGKKRKRDIQLAVASSEQQQLGVFVHKSSLANAATATNSTTSTGHNHDIDWNQYVKSSNSTSYTVRVKGYHLVEGWVVGSTDPLFIEESLLHASQVYPGQVVEATITQINDKAGLTLMIGSSMRISAFCPLLHASDTVSSILLSKRFQIGQVLTCRVWEVGNSNSTGEDGSGNASNIIVTHKKTLVQQHQQQHDENTPATPNAAPMITPILTSFEQAEVGMRTMAIVSRIFEDGVKIHMYNKLKGTMPISVLAQQGVLDLNEAFRVGQVVKVVVLQKITLPKTSKVPNKLLFGLDIGDRVTTNTLIQSLPSRGGDHTVHSNNSDGSTSIVVHESQLLQPAKGNGLVQGGVVIRQEASGGYTVRLNDGQQGYLSPSQIYDFPSLFPSIPKLAVGTKLGEVCILSSTSGTNQNNKHVVLSCKQLLVETLKTATPISPNAVNDDDDAAAADHSTAILVPNMFSQLSPGLLLAGYVNKVDATGVFVRFRDNLAALAPRPNLADRFVADPTQLFSEGQSVQCVVQRVDLTRERAIVTFKSALVGNSTGSHCFLRSYLRESWDAYSTILQDNRTTLDWSRHVIGSEVNATVTACKEYGIIFLGVDGVTVLLAAEMNYDETSYPIGSRHTVRILDIDTEKKCMLVSTTLLRGEGGKKQAAEGRKKRKKQQSVLVTVSQTPIKARIHLVRDKYLVVQLSDSEELALLMIADYHCPYADTKQYTTMIQQEVTVIVVYTSTSTVKSSSGFPQQDMPICVLQRENDTRTQMTRVQREAELADQRILTTGGPTPFLGTVQKWKVTEIGVLVLKCVLVRDSAAGENMEGQLHISNAIGKDAHLGIDQISDAHRTVTRSVDRSGISCYHPFASYHIGDVIALRVLQTRHSEGVNNKQIALLGVVVDHEKQHDQQHDQQQLLKQHNHLYYLPLYQWQGTHKLQLKHAYAAVVTKYNAATCTLALSPYISATISYLDISSDIDIVKHFQQHCYIGQKVVVAVTALESSAAVSSGAKRHNTSKTVHVSRAVLEEYLNATSPLDLTTCGPLDFNDAPVLKKGVKIQGVLNLTGKVARPPAVAVALKNNLFGRICVTELSEPATWCDLQDVLSVGKEQLPLPGGQKDGDIVSVYVLESISSSDSAAAVVEVSLRPSRLTINTDTDTGNDGKKNKKKQVSTPTAEEGLLEPQLPALGSLVSGFVVHTSSKGCFVRLSRTVTARVLIKDLTDDFVASPEVAFPTGKLVTGRVMGVDEAQRNVQLSLRASDVNGDGKLTQLSHLTENQVVSGVVQKVTDFGVFVLIDDTELVGLSRTVHAVSKGSSPLDVFTKGDAVRVRVLKIRGNKIALGLKEHYFREDYEQQEQEEEEVEVMPTHDDASDDDAGESEEDESDLIIPTSTTHADSASVTTASVNSGEGEGGKKHQLSSKKGVSVTTSVSPPPSVIEQDEEEEEEVPVSKKQKKAHKKDKKSAVEDDKDSITAVATSTSVSSTKKRKVTSASSGSSGVDESTTGAGAGGDMMVLQWDDFKPKHKEPTTSTSHDEDDDDEDDEDASSDDDNNNKRTKSTSRRVEGREAKKQRKQEEQDTFERELALQSGENPAVPSSPEDFERLLLATPNSSFVWIQYMAHHLLAADIDGARRVAEKALATIHFREEDEKMNVWVAYLNLEHKYGSMTSLETVFVRAVQESHGKRVYLALVDTYEQAGDLAGAAAVLERALKHAQYKKSKQIWARYHRLRIQQHQDKEAKALLARSLQSLSRHKHVDVISKYALAEFEYASADRARVLFEELLTTYPRRTDLWYVYIDKETKLGHITQARQLLDRMVSGHLSTRNMKAAFKKYLQFEAKYGTAEGEERVKQLAREYVTSAAAASSTTTA